MRKRLKPAGRALAALALAAALSATAAATAAAKSGDHHPGVPISAQVALDWNANAVDAVRAARTLDGLPPGAAPRPLYIVEGFVYLSYVQAAVYDAVTKIAHRYRPYHHFRAEGGNASLQAAVISAAYNTLVYYLGDATGVLAAKYTASTAALQPGKSTDRGIAVGAAAAADIEALRAGDGRNAATPVFGAPFTYTAANAGQWQVVPPNVALGAQIPWAATMRPFLLKSPSQFRAPPPPALTSALYALNFNETKTMGALAGSGRTQAQTDIAWFWNANGINQENQAFRDVAVAHSLDIVDAARLLAMGDLVATDAGIACFDSKYHYLHWRPYSAIRNADLDGNPATAADPTWSPLLATPNHPEYPAAHGCISAATSDTLAKALGTTNINVTYWGSTGGATTLTVTQHFDTVQQIQDQILDARVWGGLHWRNSDVVGETVGNAVAGWALNRYFSPVGRDEGDGDNNTSGDNNQNDDAGGND
jgi:hypothetical protein